MYIFSYLSEGVLYTKDLHNLRKCKKCILRWFWFCQISNSVFIGQGIQWNYQFQIPNFINIMGLTTDLKPQWISHKYHGYNRKLESWYPMTTNLPPDFPNHLQITNCIMCDGVASVTQSNITSSYSRNPICNPSITLNRWHLALG